MKKQLLTGILFTFLLATVVHAQTFTGTYELIGIKVIYTNIARAVESADDSVASYGWEANWPNNAAALFSVPLSEWLPGDTIAVVETPDILLTPAGLDAAGISLNFALNQEDGVLYIPGVAGTTSTYPTTDIEDCSTYVTVASVVDNANITYTTNNNSHDADAGTFTWGFGMSQSDVFDWFDAPADWDDPTANATNWGTLIGFSNETNTAFTSIQVDWYAEDGQDSNSGIDEDGFLNRHLGVSTAPGDTVTVAVLNQIVLIPFNEGSYPILGGTGYDLDGDGEPDGIVDTDWGYYFDPEGPDGELLSGDEPLQFTGYYMTYNDLAAIGAVQTAAGDDNDGDGIPDNIAALVAQYINAGYDLPTAIRMAVNDVAQAAFVAFAMSFGVDSATANVAAVGVGSFADSTFQALFDIGNPFDPGPITNTALATGFYIVGVMNALGVDTDDSDHDYNPNMTMSDNQLTNSGFEDGFTGWEAHPHDNSQAMIGTGEQMQNTTETFLAFEGDSARKLWGLDEGGANMENNAFQTYWGALLGNYTQFDVSAEFYTHSADDLNQGNSYGVLFAKYFDGGGNWAGMDSVHFRGATPDTWHHLTVSCSVPPGVAIVQVGVMHVQPADSDHGSFYVDDLAMHINYPFPNGRLVFQIGNSCVPNFQTRRVMVTCDNTALAVETDNSLPTSFAVYENYPNPFNPKTHIRFDLLKQAATEVSIWNILGQKVTTLYAGELPAGRHSVTFNGRNDRGNLLPSGVYIYRIESGTNVSTKKMMLLK